MAFEADGTTANDLGTLSKRMGAALKKAGVPAHLHGVLIPNHGLLSTRPVDRRIAAPEDYFHVRSVGDHALLQFKTLLLQHLATFQRPAEGWVPAVDQYFAQVADWRESLPERVVGRPRGKFVRMTQDGRSRSESSCSMARQTTRQTRRPCVSNRARVLL